MNSITKTMTISFITNTLLALIKIITGAFGRSGALIADGIHSLSDLITDVVAMLGAWFAKKPADEKHPFGHGKSEYVTSIIISLVIIALGFGIISNSMNASIAIPSILVTIVSLFTIISKFILASYIIKKGKQYQNNILIASGYESRTDVLSSIVVLISSILMQLSNQLSILKYTDKIATIIVGIFIIKVGFDILKENISIIVGEQETDQNYISGLTNIINQDENVIGIDSLNVLKYGPYYKLMGEVVMDGTITLKKAHQNLEQLEQKMKEYDERIQYTNIHINPK